MADRTKEVEKMIASVMKGKDLTQAQAIDYMLGVATGRLNALGRYADSVPEGKKTKGILEARKNKKRAPKSKRISILPERSDEAEKPAKKAKSAKKSAPKKSNAKKSNAKKSSAKKRAKKPAELESASEMVVE